MNPIAKINENIIPVKVGVIGIGNMGWHHARVLSLLKDAELVGVADLDEERGKLAMDQFNCNWYRNYKIMQKKFYPLLYTIIIKDLIMKTKHPKQ